MISFLCIPNALSSQCVNLLNEASTQIQNVDLYNVYGDCVNAASCSASASDKVGNSLNYASENKTGRGKVPDRPVYTAKDKHTGAEHRMLSARIIPNGPDACIDSKLASAFLNQPDVQAAIHVDISNLF